MAFFNKILFPADLSESSKYMVPYVKEIVDKFGAELHAVHVKYIDHYYLATFVDETELESTLEEEDRIERFIESNFENFGVHSKILTGPPGPEILKYAGNETMDLIIMGHNSKGLARAVFGSVAGYVIKHSQVPVLILSPDILEKKDWDAVLSYEYKLEQPSMK